MNKKINLLSALVLSLMFNQAIFASDTPPTPHVKCACGAMQKMIHKLDLTVEQQTKIKAIKNSFKDFLEAKQKELHAINVQINEHLKSDQFDEEVLNKLVNLKKETWGAIIKTKAMIKHQIYRLLDAKQKEKFAAMWDHKNKTSNLKAPAVEAK